MRAVLFKEILFSRALQISFQEQRHSFFVRLKKPNENPSSCVLVIHVRPVQIIKMLNAEESMHAISITSVQYLIYLTMNTIKLYIFMLF